MWALFCGHHTQKKKVRSFHHRHTRIREEFGNTSNPMVIPFDGPYWYFKALAKKPGLKALLVRGLFFMEGHQNLGSSTNLNCC
jgi:hypothetical protein